jgi:hypothetical protein
MDLGCAMSRLLHFYRGKSTDAEGRSLEEILAWDDDDLEAVHDFIQWLFPLPEASQFNPNAPLLTEKEIAVFKKEPVLQANLLKSFERILRFLGLALAEDGNVAEGKNFSAGNADVWAMPNHNWLRISRILRSLTLLGMETKAQALYRLLEAFYKSGKYPIPANTFQFWTKAIKPA